MRCSQRSNSGAHRRAGTLVFAVCLALFLLSCTGHGTHGDVTGVRLTITAELDVSSFVIRGTDESTRSFEQIIVPEEQRPLDPEGEVVDVIVDNDLGGTLLRFRVDAIAWGDIYATERLEITLETGELLPLPVHFGPRSECGDGALDPDREECDDGDVSDDDGCSANCELEPGFECTTEPGQRSRCSPLCGEIVCGDGQRCVEEECVCDGQSCAGCCDGDQCLEGGDVEGCGSGGQSCEACSGTAGCIGGVCEGCDSRTCESGCCSGNSCHAVTTDTCGLEGRACIACDRLIADRCSAAGECTCGSNPACESGQRCSHGECVCDTEICPDGCCAGNRCVSPTTASECGAGGATCIACDEVTADTCNAAGECRCGSRRPCVPGQRCRSGLCVCDVGSCSDGCCLDNNCISPSFMAACGVAGADCEACDMERSDTCDVAGGCQCGDQPPCSNGQRCDDGACVCDGSSCVGCCSGDTCLRGDDSGACGAGGGVCEACPASETCADGVCSSCTASSCAEGCCSGPTCSTSELATCGVGGNACVACNPERSDTCADGSCACGSNPPCANGERCVSGSCDCDDVSCPIGCCDDGTCMAPSPESCGVEGASCVACDPHAADSCDLAGACRCGLEPPCESEELCVGGWCV